MGYTDISIGGSDRATGLVIDLAAAMLEVLKKEMTAETTELNTDGPINVALVFEEIICQSKAFDNDSGLMKLAERCVKYLDENIYAIKQSKPSEWGPRNGKEYHLKRYQQLRRKIQNWLDR